MRRIHVATVALALSLGAVSVASAQQPASPRAEQGERGFGRRGGEGMKGLFKGINLSAAQKNQVKAIREKYKGQEKALREQMKPLREQFAAARKTNDTARLEQLREQVRPQMERARALRQQQMQEVRGVLNAE